jgi:lipid A oxidase
MGEIPMKAMRADTGILKVSAWPGRAGVVRTADAALSFAAAVALVVMVAQGVTDDDVVLAKDPVDIGAKSDGGAADRSRVAPRSEWMVAAYGGSPYTYPSDVKFTKPGARDFTVKDVQWQGLPFVNPIYYGVRVMRWFGDGRIGSMLDFTHSKAISDRQQQVKVEGTIDGKPAPESVLIGDMFSKLEASHGHNMLTINGLLRLPSFTFRLSPYVGLGAGVSLPHSEVQIKTDPSRTYEYQMAGPVGQAVIGLEFRLPRMSYFLEYKFTLADYRMPLTGRDGDILFTDVWRQLSEWWKGVEPRDGWAETRYTSHQVIGGLGVRLPTAP